MCKHYFQMVNITRFDTKSTLYFCKTPSLKTNILSVYILITRKLLLCVRCISLVTSNYSSSYLEQNK